MQSRPATVYTDAQRIGHIVGALTGEGELSRSINGLNKVLSSSLPIVPVLGRLKR